MSKYKKHIISGSIILSLCIIISIFAMIPIQKNYRVNYEALEADGAVGYVAQTTVNGFGGPIEIIAGVDNEGRITGVSVGGSNFAETPGLGANAKNKSFTDEFIGKHGGISAVKAGKVRGENDIDAMTSATITSSAVADGVNIICSYVENIGSASQEASAPAQSSETENTENGEGGAV